MKKLSLALFVSTLIAFGGAACGGAPEAVVLSCGDSVKDLSENPMAQGDSFDAVCPADCTNGSVWGVDVYTTDSDICVAAVHAGAIGTEGGEVTVTRSAGLDEYAGEERNGVTTRTWGSYDGSFSVE